MKWLMIKFTEYSKGVEMKFIIVLLMSIMSLSVYADQSQIPYKILDRSEM
ncbi:hypothetical protein DFP81_101298 [Marinomonas pollencensis]|uniref:Uncharacterized protein n=1 Tax=Marinomonas pollencensis TaxID=491954 RepID=A0A3E0DT75_9GAMM|nr:hypothetical protein DFP81_101298 [Marinomonas pollencensis]